MSQVAERPEDRYSIPPALSVISTIHRTSPVLGVYPAISVQSLHSCQDDAAHGARDSRAELTIDRICSRGLRRQVCSRAVNCPTISDVLVMSCTNAEDLSCGLYACMLCRHYGSAFEEEALIWMHFLTGSRNLQCRVST